MGGVICGVIVPYKVKIFLWRLRRNNILVRNLLRGRGVQTTVLCPMCMVDVEHLMHVFLDCSLAQQCWSNLGLSFDVSIGESFPVRLLERLKTESKECKVQIAMVLWGIWYARNLKVWDAKQIVPEILMEGSVKQITQWREARKSIWFLGMSLQVKCRRSSGMHQ